MATGADRICYSADTRASQFVVQAFASGLIAAVAHSPKIAIRDWTGEVQMSSNKLQDASLRVRVKAASLEVLDELRDDDRREIHRVMNKEVLETQRFPEVAYESTGIAAEKLKDDLYRIKVSGRLMLHGVSSDLGFEAQAAMGIDTARVFGTFTLLQSDYDIRIASIAGGSLKLQDELKFTFYIVARKPE
ncbi:MAG: YceI family protein [Terriglobales bacterium]|jgi:polyisoprenoid-binding protein YceI